MAGPAPGGPRDVTSQLAGHRPHRTLALAAAVGVVTGAVVALFDWLAADKLLDTVLSWPVAVQAFAPLVGLLLAAASLHWLAGRATPDVLVGGRRSTCDQCRAGSSPPWPRSGSAEPSATRARRSMRAPRSARGCSGGFRATSGRTTPRSSWSLAPLRASPPSSKPRSPAWSSRSRSPIRRTWPAACCCPPGSPPPPATSCSPPWPARRRCCPSQARRPSTFATWAVPPPSVSWPGSVPAWPPRQSAPPRA